MAAWRGPPEGWACSGSGAMRINHLSPLAALYVTPNSLQTLPSPKIGRLGQGYRSYTS